MQTNSEAIVSIDAKVESLQEQIRELYTQRNHLVPVSTLPLEIFTSIIKKAFTERLSSCIDSSRSAKSLVPGEKELSLANLSGRISGRASPNPLSGA
ncbi:hypothetical protein BDN72DRAFT_299552 [Pluteus cervinus]|uniref:Uncharacterized protein n=1 Tax=Pluteus cervinus TaxID=181527 RepID=A0ACD3AD48_9AGAR|nr:hypothetical protein BDN72DRAFT_299552 [Pluteus cervinus]